MTCMVDSVPANVNLTLVTSDRDLGCRTPYPGLSGRWMTRSRSKVFYLNLRSPAQWLRIWRHQRSAGPFDLLYVNSVWQPGFSLLPVLATVLRLVAARRILIAPRGEFSPGALGIRSRKKRLFLAFWRRVLDRRDVVWHATNDREAAQIRALVAGARIVVCENETLLPVEPSPPREHGDASLRLVFISRITPMKNLDLVLRALQSVSRPLTFDIYGPVDDPSYWRECQRLCDELPATVTVRYRGPLPPAEVRATFARYDAFVLPTRGENFGHVIAESLSVSCPVVCSAETPWTEVLNGGGGVVLSAMSAAQLSRVIEGMAADSPAERYERRVRAGGAYRSWRARKTMPSVLDLVRTDTFAGPTGTPSQRRAVRVPE
ncbi:glycosyltransferase [Micromonospora sp. NPDC006766]|uniref:glycosyltransferase n=1 Tax=Micromonospora sp. NPDC006766 TaxID=3154778 RepID=UPI0033E59E8D